MIDLARVVRVDWKSSMVDLVMSSDGRAISGVRVMSHSASTNTGFTDIPKPDVTATKEFETGGSSKTRDIIAVVAFYNGLPVVIGFLHPQVSQMMFAEEERMIYRHASDVYQTIDQLGNIEIAHPSGAFIRMATSPAHEDLTGRDFDKKWKIARNTTSQVHIHIEQAGGLASIDIAPSGAITINSASTVTVTAAGAVAVNAPSVTLNTPTTHCTGALNVDGLITGSSGLAISGGGATSAAIVGRLTTTQDVVAGTVSLQGHHHGGVQAGAGNTGTAI